ncbi:substrate-binding periplasmic protein [Pseudomonadota bacterium]
MARNLLAAIIFVLLCPVPSWAAETLVIASRENTLTNRYVESVLVKAYARMDIGVEFVHYPDARSVIAANDGYADGEAARLEAVVGNFPNLMLVPVPLFYSDLSVFFHQGYDINISNWESLAGYSATTIRGFEYVKKKLAGQKLKVVKTTAEAVSLIDRDLVEVAVLNSLLGQLAIREAGVKNVMEHAPPLDRLPVYHLLHKKHVALVPKLTNVLEGMERDGSLRTMWESFVADELQKASDRAAQ